MAGWLSSSRTITGISAHLTGSHALAEATRGCGWITPSHGRRSKSVVRLEWEPLTKVPKGSAASLKGHNAAASSANLEADLRVALRSKHPVLDSLAE